MALFGKGKKEDLRVLCYEINEVVSPEAKIEELRDIILNSDYYEEEFVRDFLFSIIEDRENKERLEIERQKWEIQIQKREKERQHLLKMKELEVRIRMEERERARISAGQSGNGSDITSQDLLRDVGYMKEYVMEPAKLEGLRDGAEGESDAVLALKASAEEKIALSLGKGEKRPQDHVSPLEGRKVLADRETKRGFAFGKGAEVPQEGEKLRGENGQRETVENEEPISAKGVVSIRNVGDGRSSTPRLQVSGVYDGMRRDARGMKKRKKRTFRKKVKDVRSRTGEAYRGDWDISDPMRAKSRSRKKEVEVGLESKAKTRKGHVGVMKQKLRGKRERLWMGVKTRALKDAEVLGKGIGRKFRTRGCKGRPSLG